MDADHQKSAFASKRGVPKCPFGELYVLHFQTDDFFKTKFCGKQEKYMDMETAKRIQAIFGYSRIIVLLVILALCWFGMNGML